MAIDSCFWKALIYIAHAHFEWKCSSITFNSAGVTAAKQNVLQKFWKLLLFGREKVFLFCLNDVIILLDFKWQLPSNPPRLGSAHLPSDMDAMVSQEAMHIFLVNIAYV